MGGKKQPRTKNNAQPSSSDRHARQLGSSQLIGFSTLTDLGYVPAAVAGAAGDEGAGVVSGHMRAVLKKMAKRDAITKSKAVQEFADMCESNELEDVKATLPFWPRLYRRLATDIDNRVRELSHVALQHLLARVRKAATPHMTELVPVWLCAQSDPYPPAASAARRAFQTAFPAAEKQAGAVRFCYSAILSHISEGLYDLTPQTYSDASMMTPDELDARYIRLLTGCLWGLHELLDLLPSSDAEYGDLQPLADIVHNARFCKLAKHTRPQVRRAWCGLLTRLCERRPELVTAAASRLAPAAIQTLGEQDPAVITDCWNAVICLITALPDIWSQVNVRKAVLPQLWPLLREGGRGCAASLHPLMIVLLDKLPSEVAGGAQPEFHRLFFSAMMEGVTVERVQQSPREVSVIVRSVLECALYVLRNGCSDAVTDVIVEQLSVLTSEVVTGSLRRVSAHTLPPLSTGLNSLYTLSVGCDAAAAAQTQYWRSLEQAMLRQHLTESSSSTAAVVDLLLSCASVNVTPTSTETRPRVTFSLKTPQPSTETTSASSSPSKPAVLSPLASSASSPLIEATCRVGQYFMDRALADSASSDEKEQLVRLLVGVPGIAERVARRPAPGPGWTLYLTLLVPEMADGGEAMVQQMAETVYRLCSEEERTRLLQDVTQNGHMPMVVELLRVAASSSSDDRLTSWAASGSLHSFLLSAVSNASTPGGQGWKHTLLAIPLVLQCHKHREETGSDLAGALLYAAAERRWPLQQLAPILSPHCRSSAALLSAHSTSLRSGGSSAALAALQTRLGDIDESSDAEVADQLRAVFSEATSGVLRARLASVALAWARVVGSVRFCRQITAMLPENWALSAPRHSAQICLLLRKRSTLRPLAGVEGESQVSCRAVTQYLRTILVGLIAPNEPKDACENDAEKTRDEEHSQDKESTEEENLTYAAETNPADEDAPAESTGTAHPSNNTHSSISSSCVLITTSTITEYLPDLLACHAAQTAADQLSSTSADAKAERQLTQLVTSLSHNQRGVVLKEVMRRAQGGTDGVDGAALALLLSLGGAKISDLCEIVYRTSTPCRDQTELLLWLSSHLPDASLAALVAPPGGHMYRLSLVAACLSHLTARRGTDHVIAECGAGLLAAMDVLVAARDDGTLPTSWEEAGSGWDRLVDCTSVLRVFEAVLEHCSCLLEPCHWDLIMLSISSWVAALEDLVSTSAVTCGASSVSLSVLLHALSGTVAATRSAVLRCGETNAEVGAEWDDLYCPEWYRSLVHVYARLATCDTGASEDREAVSAALGRETLTALCSAVVEAPSSALRQHSLPALVDADLDESHLAAEVVTLVSWWRRLLTVQRRCAQLVAWQTMHRYLPYLAEAEQVRTPEGADRDEPRLPLPTIFRVILAQTTPLVATVLSDLPAGGLCTVDPACEDTLHVVLTHLQTWHLALSYTSHLDTARKAMTAEALRSDGSVDRLLYQLFSLMPESPDIVPASYSDTQLNYFQLPPKLNMNGMGSVEEVHHWACITYCELLRQLPVLARGWCSSCERALNQRVDRLTSQYVSPLLLAEEFSKLHTADTAVDNMKVRARPSVREVCAVYTLEEASTELVVRLPADYPLGAVVADASGRRVGVAAGQWRTWMLQLTTFLMHQNGSVLAGLLLWKQNMDKRFQGAEECNICFYVLHGTNYQLPKLACRNCKKRFHSACLYKWFSTSSKSTCPMCRQLF